MVSFKALAEIKIHADGTITGQMMKYPDIEGVNLVDNGIYRLGYDDWEGKVAIEFKGKDNECL